MLLEPLIENYDSSFVDFRASELKSLCIVVTYNSLETAIEEFKKKFDGVIETIYVHSKDPNKKVGKINLSGINIEDFNEELYEKDNLVAFIDGEFSDMTRMLYQIKKGIKHKYYYYLFDTKFTGMLSPLGKNPDYVKVNREKLERAYSLLKDKESKEIFLRRIKMIQSGQIGYLLMSDFEEYYHPEVKIQSGDYFIDGGVSRYVNLTHDWANMIGDEGKIFAFEPEPTEYKLAKDALEKLNLKNVNLYNLGLWNKKDTLFISEGECGSSVVCGSKDNACDLVALDEFVAKRKISKVDVIKLDIEGAELQALQGMKKTIKKNKPRLLISIYHKKEDLFQLLLYIESLNVGYEYYIGHSSAVGWETTLYAIAKEPVTLTRKFDNILFAFRMKFKLYDSIRRTLKKFKLFLQMY